MRRRLEEIFYSILFVPIDRVIDAQGPEHLQNASEDPLQVALGNGRVQLTNGVFSGEFSAAISKSLRAIGATFDKKSRTYRIDPQRIPPWVRSASGAYNLKARAVHAEIKRAIDEIQKRFDQAHEVHDVEAQQTIDKMQDGWKTAAEVLRVSPVLASDSRARLSADYNKNMDLWIRGFTKQMIVDLRSDVERNATEGYRFDKLVDKIQRRKSMTYNKAKFLARQETGLFMSKFRQQRFGEAGVTEYFWRTSHDERVRPAPGVHGVAALNNHRILDGKRFSYANPPIVDSADGRTANPGEDYNCRCVDEPIIPAFAAA